MALYSPTKMLGFLKDGSGSTSISRTGSKLKMISMGEVQDDNFDRNNFWSSGTLNRYRFSPLIKWQQYINAEYKIVSTGLNSR